MTAIPVTDADHEAAEVLLAAAFVCGELTKDILAEWRAEARAEGEKAEAERWGARLDFFHEEFGADGSGCDSGDPLDVIVSEARQVIVRLTDERAAARAEGAASEREACIAAIVAACPKAHTYASENADLYRAYDQGALDAMDTIRARGEAAK